MLLVYSNAAPLQLPIQLLGYNSHTTHMLLFHKSHLIHFYLFINLAGMTTAGKRSLKEAGIAAAVALALFPDPLLEAEEKAKVNEEDEAIREADLVLVPKAVIEAVVAATVKKTCGM